MEFESGLSGVPKLIRFGVELGKASVDKLLDVLKTGDWKQMLAYIDEESAHYLFWAFRDLEILKNIEFIGGGDKYEFVQIDFYRAFAFSQKPFGLVIPKKALFGLEDGSK